MLACAPVTRIVTVKVTVVLVLLLYFPPSNGSDARASRTGLAEFLRLVNLDVRLVRVA